MKKLALIFALLVALPFAAFGQGLGNAWTTVEKKVTQTFKPDKKCPVYSDSPRSSIDRPDFEIDFRVGILDSPTGGSFAVVFENFDLVVRHNLSSTLFAYAWGGMRDYQKDNVTGSAYDPKWKSRSVFLGGGVYIMPTISVYAAAGKIWTTNENGDSPTLDMAVERGISIDAPIWENKVVLSYRIIDARQSDQDGLPVEQIQGDGSYSVVSVAFSVPFSWGQ